MQWRNISRERACRAGSRCPPCTFLGTSPSLFSYRGEMPDVALVRGGGERLRLAVLLKLFCTALVCLKDLNNYLQVFVCWFVCLFVFSCILQLLLFLLLLLLFLLLRFWFLILYCWKDEKSHWAGSPRWKLWWYALEMSLKSKQVIKISLSLWMIPSDLKNYSQLLRPPWLTPGWDLSFNFKCQAVFLNPNEIKAH